MDESLLELAVDPQSLQCRRLSAQRLRGPEGADRAGFQSGVLIDDQVQVGGVRPPLPPVLKLHERAPSEVVQRPDPGGDDELTVAEIHVVESHPTDPARAGGVHHCEGDHEPVGRGRGRTRRSRSITLTASSLPANALETAASR